MLVAYPFSQMSGAHRSPITVVAFGVHSQIFMAVSAAALICASAHVMEVELSPWWYVTAILGTWMIYLLDAARSHDAEDQLSQPVKASLYRRHPSLGSILPWLAGAAGLFTTWLADPSFEMICLLIGLGIAGLAYVLPILPLGNHGGNNPNDTPSRSFRTLKQIAVLKPITICLAWTAGSVLIPLLADGRPATTMMVDAAWLCGLWFPLLLADTMLLDVRDLEGDQDQGLRTPAIRIGRGGSHLLVGSCLGVGWLVLLCGESSVMGDSPWLQVGMAGLLGLLAAWMSWPLLKHSEAGIALGLMGWRFLAAIMSI